jgi:hypothetical protein
MELAECHLSGASNFEEAARFFEKLCTCASARLRSYFTRFLESHFRLYIIFRSAACSSAAQQTWWCGSFPLFCLNTDHLSGHGAGRLLEGPRKTMKLWTWYKIQRCSNESMVYAVRTFVPVRAFLILGKQMPRLNLRLYVQTFSEWIFVTRRLFLKWQYFSSSAPIFPKQHFFLDLAQQLVWT